MITETEYAYLAGIIDGEGHIQPWVQYAAYGNSINVKVNISNKHLGVLEWIAERWGGFVTIHRDSKGHECFQLTIASKQLTEMFRGILPYSIIKKTEVAASLRIRELIESNPSRNKVDLKSKLERAELGIAIIDGTRSRSSVERPSKFYDSMVEIRDEIRQILQDEKGGGMADEETSSFTASGD